MMYLSMKRRNRIANRAFYDRTWGLLQKILIDFGVTMGNLMAFEYTYVHWYHQFESVPMNVAMEAVLQPLYKIELQSYIDDLPEDEPEESKTSHKEILVDSLTNIKNFMSSFGVTVRDLLDQEKERFDPYQKGKGKAKDQPKGGTWEPYPALGGKSQGKSGSTNKPKEPTPLTKQGETEAPDKPKDAVVVTKTKPQGPPTKAGKPAPPVIVEAATPKAKSEAVPQTDQPKTEGQPKPPLTLTSQTRKLEFGPPSKPEKPPPQHQAELVAKGDDDDADLQAALHELDRLTEESVRLESLSNPTLRDRSRIRSIATVSDDIEQKIREIESQRQAQSSSKMAKTQEARAPEVKPSVLSQVRSKESKKAEKRRKKESKRRHRSESDEPQRGRSRKEERSRSTKRPESPLEQQSQVVQIEVSETDTSNDPPGKGESRAVSHREQVVADKKRIVQPPREHRRDPSTEGPPDREEERRMKRRPPLPPPATSTRQGSVGHKPLAFARPPPRMAGSASESSFVPSERGPLRLRVRVEDTPSQRPILVAQLHQDWRLLHIDQHKENIRVNPM